MVWLNVYLSGGLAILILMTALWLISVRLKDASIVDSFWGPGFGLAALTYFALGDGFVLRKLLITGMVLAWGLRLGFHIFRRNHGQGEDFRYQAWRKQSGARSGGSASFRSLPSARRVDVVDFDAADGGPGERPA